MSYDRLRYTTILLAHMVCQKGLENPRIIADNFTRLYNLWLSKNALNARAKPGFLRERGDK